MMDTIEAIMARRSIRKYKPDNIPEDDLKTLLEVARQAPSAANRQPRHIVVVKDPGIKRRVAEACNGQTWVGDADVVIAGVALPDVSEKWCVVDTTIAMENLIIAAASMGYGTCWIGAFREDEVKKILNIPADKKVVALTPLGVPDVSPPAKSRKPIDQLFSLDEFGKRMK